MSKSQFHSTFEKIFENIGDDGQFQTKFNILFNFVLLVLVCMPNLNLYLIMSVPQHWCHVPGREYTNFTLEQWKSLTIPSTNDGINSTLSSCKMFKKIPDHFSLNISYSKYPAKEEIIDCQYGWEYDKTWYTATIPSQENWVCDNELLVTNTFVFARIGDIIGSFIFGQLGDAFGRTIIYYSTLSTLLIGRVLLIFTPSYVNFFMFSIFLGGLACTSVFQAPLVIAMEITAEEKHATITMMQCIGWTVAFCTMPMIMWVLKDWIPFLLITSLPCGIFLFAQKYLIESPRWLATKGKKERCFKELKKIAQVNGVKVTDDLTKLVNDACSKREVTYGLISIFLHWRLMKNTFLYIYGTIITNMVYFILTLNISNMSGNPFMNFFWQGFAELPGYIFGKILCNKIGRRLTNIVGAIGMTLGSFVLIFSINDPSYELYSQLSIVSLKLFLSLSFYAVNLIAIEIFPTSVRQSGCALGGITANIFGIISPYIVYMGTSLHASYPYIISAVLSLIGVLLGFFLPETLYEKLPETLTDAYAFGKDQPFWYIPRKSNHKIIDNDA